LILLVLRDEVLEGGLGLGELLIDHALAEVLMHESTLAVHLLKVLQHMFKRVRYGCRVE
jgi:hypothetical protein